MAAATQLLVTGFEPFNAFKTNPSWSAAKNLQEQFPGRITARLLPVDYFAAREKLYAALEEVQPAACLCMGLAAGDVFRMEELARKPVQFAAMEGPDSFNGTWNWDGIEAELRRLEVPHRRSTDAGRYVCESAYYSLLQFASTRGFPTSAGFLHVPAISERFPEQSIVDIVRAVVGSAIT